MKIAVITGASSGMGRYFAKELDKKGLDELWLIARREGRLKELEKRANQTITHLIVNGPAMTEQYGRAFGIGPEKIFPILSTVRDSEKWEASRRWV